MAKIETPVAHFTGRSAGVDFVDGVGNTDDEAAIAYFTQAGYVVNGDQSDESVIGEQKPVGDLTVKELKVLAQQKGITVPADAKKADLVDLLDAKDVADPGSAPAPFVSEGVENVQPGTGGETGAAAGAVFGGTPASSDINNEDAQGEVVA